MRLFGYETKSERNTERIHTSHRKRINHARSKPKANQTTQPHKCHMNKQEEEEEERKEKEEREATNTL